MLRIASNPPQPVMLTYPPPLRSFFVFAKRVVNYSVETIVFLHKHQSMLDRIIVQGFLVLVPF